MKKFLFLLLTVTLLTACSSDGDEDFNHDITMLYGTWYPKAPAEIEETEHLPSVALIRPSLTFRNDGTFEKIIEKIESNRSVIDNYEYLNGTYKATGDIIKCYRNGSLFQTYRVISLTSDKVEFDVTDPNTNKTTKEYFEKYFMPQ